MSGEMREVRLDGGAVIAQLVALRTMADAISATASALLIALGAEPGPETIQRPEELTAPGVPRFGRQS